MTRFRTIAGVVVAGGLAAGIAVATFRDPGGRSDLPSYDFVRITSANEKGSMRLVPLPSGYEPGLSAGEAVAASLAPGSFEAAVKSSTRLLVRLGLHQTQPPGQDIYDGRPLYAVSGNQAVACPGFGGPPGAPPRPPKLRCHWTMYLDADTGDFVGMSFVPEGVD